MTTLAALLLCVPVGAQEKEEPDLLAIEEAVRPSLVRVEYTLRFDRGEEPQGEGWSMRFDSVIREERPAETPGFLAGGRLVVAPDPVMHPRFVEKIAVRYGESVVGAKVSGYAKEHAAVFLELDAPLEGAKPLEFAAGREEPYFTARHELSEARWLTHVAALALSVTRSERGREFSPVDSPCVVVDEEGGAVALVMNGEVPLDDSWKVSPDAWTSWSAEEMKERLEKLDGRAERLLPRVSVHFRSPKKKSDSGMGYRPYRSGREGSATLQTTAGVMLDAKTILIPLELDATVTARLEKIDVHFPDGAVRAKFAHSLKDFGALLATLEKPVDVDPQFSEGPILDWRWKLLFCVEVRVKGQARFTYAAHRRLTSFDLGWKRRVYPMARRYEDQLFLFDETGAMVVFPVSHRKKPSLDRYGRYEGEEIPTPVGYVTELLDNIEEHVAPDNVPVVEEEEERVAWMGVHLQPLNHELARVNKVSQQSRDGEIGALVSYVYPESPAGKAGIVPGDILLRLHVEDLPKPVEVAMERMHYFTSRPFPWDQLDQLDDRYVDRIPTPWPPAENMFTRMLTDLGFGKKYEAEFARDGEIFRKAFTVERSPTHYGLAARHVSEDLGITVRDLTYEVRRYFQMKPEDRGVIVSRVKQGSRAFVSGLRPFEIIEQVNGRPVHNVKEYEEFAQGQEELRLAVKRLTIGRIVKIKQQ